MDLRGILDAVRTEGIIKLRNYGNPDYGATRTYQEVHNDILAEAEVVPREAPTARKCFGKDYERYLWPKSCRD